MSALVEEMDIVNTSEAGTVESAETVESEEEQFFQDIDLLLEANIQDHDVNLLKKIGLNTIKAVQMTMRKKLLEIQGFNEEKVDKIKEACCKVALNNGFLTALEVSNQRNEIFRISTGSSALE